VNRSGFCTAHFYDSKRKDNPAPRGRLRKVADPRPLVSVKANGHANGNANGNGSVAGTATLKVSREQIVSMFTGWPLEDQVGAVQLWLDRN
jgi:hypothetical protein